MKGKRFITYVNHKYHFRLNLPKWWEKHIFLRHVNRKKGTKTEEEIQFYLKYRKALQGKRSALIFSLVIFRMSAGEWRAAYADSPFQFIAHRQGRVYAILVPAEPPDEFLRPDLQDYDRTLLEFRWLTRMVNKELPDVMKSFCFSRRLKRCRCSWTKAMLNR